MFHPYTWTRLGDEYDQQMGFFRDLGTWLEQRREEGASQKELKELQRRREETQSYARRIFCKLYGVHYIRERYFNYYRDGGAIPDDFIVNETLDFEMAGSGLQRRPLVSREPHHSVWPLPLPISAISGPPALTRKPLTSIVGLSDAALVRYTTPSFNLEWPHTWCPMPPAEIRRRYQHETRMGRIAAAERRRESGVVVEEEEPVEAEVEQGGGLLQFAKKASKRILGAGKLNI
ncbi:hypothetical protein JCM6882_001385 [Rhodosporidiobolus microsporus]